MFSRIRWRIAALFTLLFLVVLVPLAVFVSGFVLNSQFESSTDLLTAQAHWIANALIADPRTENSRTAMETLAGLWADTLNARVTFITMDGEVIADSALGVGGIPNQAGAPEIAAAAESGSGFAVRRVSELGEDMLLAAARADVNAAPIAFVTVSIPYSEIESAALILRNRILLLAFVVSIVVVLLSVFISAQITRPLTRLTQQARQVAEGASEFSILDGPQGEVHLLARAMRGMAEQLQQQVHESAIEQNKLAAMLDQMRDAVVIADELGRVILLNRAAEALFDTSFEGAFGRSLAQVLRRHEFIETWQTFQLAGEEQSISVEIPQRDQFLQMLVSPLSDQLEGYTLLQFQDLTRIRHLETVRRDFISNISHELRTPLASLKALAETLQAGALKDEKAASHFLERIDIEVDALTQMVGELLELSRIESGQVPLQLSKGKLSGIVSKAAGRLLQQAHRGELTLSLAPCDFPDRVNVDASRMEQVFINLIHNAIKFTPAGGSIEIDYLLDPEGRIAVRISDSGVGIPQEDLARIFERFYKSDPARATSGTGLGLAIARHIVDGHRGRIWAESREGQGSQFFVSLPLAD
jgi:two-component system phosphate regulon sensor histidine kinase PhoR